MEMSDEKTLENRMRQDEKSFKALSAEEQILCLFRMMQKMTFLMSTIINKDF